MGQRVFHEINVEFAFDVPANVAPGISFKTEDGMFIVTEVAEGSPAAEGRFRAEDKIVEINNRNVANQNVAVTLATSSEARMLIVLVSRVIPAEEVCLLILFLKAVTYELFFYLVNRLHASKNSLVVMVLLESPCHPRTHCAGVKALYHRAWMNTLS